MTAFLSTNRTHLQEKTNRIDRFAKQIGLNLNTSKTQVMCINSTPDAPITVDGNTHDYVEECTYLGSLLSKDNACSKVISVRLGEAHSPFASLQTIWKSKQYSFKTELQLYNSNVKSVLLYSSECWLVVESDMEKISVFHNGCLRYMICHIFWPENISNEDLYNKTNCRNVVQEIKHRRLRWLRYVLQMDQDCIPKVALRWTPPGKRKQGRPKTTWRTTVTSELKMAHLTWGEAQHAAQDRTKWKQIVAA